MNPININDAIYALSKNELNHIPLESFDYLSGLNERQKIAATRGEGNYLVIAGPGTGKTHTLAYRVVHLVKSGVDPKSIVVITFTRKAGNELKSRINYLLPNLALGFIGTFHGFSHYISSLIGGSSPISKFRLLDQEDDVQVHKLVMADFHNFNKNIRAQRLQKIISYCTNTQLSIKDYIHQQDLNDLKDDIELISAYKESYDRYKSDHMLANYDDMIVLVSRYLKQHGENKITAPFHYLMVDEYQDTNQMQLDFIKSLKIQNTMVIGDDFQGIYAFRGADHRIILNFYNDFENAQMIKLVENYRSTEPIIQMINKTVKSSQLGYQKELIVTNKRNGSAQVISGTSLLDHKHLILDNIKKYPDSKHALIYRYNKNRMVYEKAMIEEKIDYSVYGGIRLLERKHIKDVLAFIMVYLNKLDVVSFNRILTLLPGIGPKTASGLIKTELSQIDKMSGEKKIHLITIREILNSSEDKIDLFDNICKFYFSIYDHVASEFYTKEEVTEDFRLVRELLTSFDSLQNFIISIILDPVVDLHKGKNPKVVLTTIHSAKGLEFDYVYYFHTHDWYKNYDSEKLEEDRRLFYVGISRAKSHLYIFDHTEFKRDFNRILKDFENNYTSVTEENSYSEQVLEKPSTYVANDKKTDSFINSIKSGDLKNDGVGIHPNKSENVMNRFKKMFKFKRSGK